MSVDDEIQHSDAWAVAAAEYVLGLLCDDELRAFEAELARNPDLQQDVSAWSEYFSTLVDPIAQVAPPQGLARRIEIDAFGATPPSIWQQILPYLLGAVAGAGLVWAVMISGVLTPASQELRVDLRSVIADFALTVRFDPQSGVLAVAPPRGTPPDGRVPELWLIAAPEDQPVSLGVIPEQGLARVLPPELAERVPGATLSISAELPGGSTTGHPSGAILASGEIL